MKCGATEAGPSTGSSEAPIILSVGWRRFPMYAVLVWAQVGSRVWMVHWSWRGAYLPARRVDRGAVPCVPFSYKHRAAPCVNEALMGQSLARATSADPSSLVLQILSLLMYVRPPI